MNKIAKQDFKSIVEMMKKIKENKISKDFEFHLLNKNLDEIQFKLTVDDVKKRNQM